MGYLMEERELILGGESIVLPVHCPEQTDDVIQIFRLANQTGKKVWPIGNLTKLVGLVATKFTPEKYLFLSTNRLRGVVEYVPQNLCLVAWSGTTVQEVVHTAANKGQYCPALQYLPNDATIGGTAAANEPHLLEHSLGNVRHFVSGVELINHQGRLLFGGKNVKNVSGYEISKFLAGSRGVFGPLTQITLFLKPIPEDTRTYVAVLSGGTSPDEGEGAELETWFRQQRRELRSLTGCWAVSVPEGIQVVLQLSGTYHQVEEDGAKLGGRFTQMAAEEAKTLLTRYNQTLKRSQHVVLRKPADMRKVPNATIDLREGDLWDLGREEILLSVTSAKYRLQKEPSGDNCLALKGLLERMKEHLDPNGLFVGRDAYAD